jgi:hypothetical protein
VPYQFAKNLTFVKGVGLHLSKVVNVDPLNFLATVMQPLLKSPAPPLLHVAALGQKQGILGAQPQLIFQPHRIPPLFPQKRKYQRHGCYAGYMGYSE